MLQQEKLTGHVGGIELLCAIGFQVRVQDGLAAATPENRVTALGQALSLREQVAALGARVFPTESHLCDDDDDNDLSGDSKNECSRARAVDMFPFLAPHTLWDVHLEMHEPAVEALTEVGETNGAAVKLSWLDWFDGLTNSKNAIDVALETL